PGHERPWMSGSEEGGLGAGDERHAPPAFREAKAMTRAEVIGKPLEKEIPWTRAATINGVRPRRFERLRASVPC
ncbi:MAG TPA: hypothetical protein PK313_17040, partial [Myxococcota bacterium]|nr:hypothetical protein [Myxococcota bacterium]